MGPLAHCHMRPVQLITLQVSELESIVSNAVHAALRDKEERHASDAAGLSMNGAARLARRRRETVSTALESGALRGKRYGASKVRPRWSIIAADVRDWLARGCPVEVAQ